MVVRWGADYIPNTKLCEETESNADTADFDIGGYERRNRNQHNGDTEVIEPPDIQEVCRTRRKGWQLAGFRDTMIL